MDEMPLSWRLLIFAALVSTGCTTQTRVPVPYTWVDSPVDELIHRWGAPHEVLINERENRVLMYLYRKYVFAERGTVEVDWSPVAAEFREDKQQRDSVYKMTCAVFYEVNGPTVVAWDWRGAACSRILPAKLRRTETEF